MPLQPLDSFRFDQIQALARCLARHLAPEPERLELLATFFRVLSGWASVALLPALPLRLDEAVATAVDLWLARGMAAALGLQLDCAIEPAAPQMLAAPMVEQVVYFLLLRAEWALAASPATGAAMPWRAILRGGERPGFAWLELACFGPPGASVAQADDRLFQICARLLEPIGGRLVATDKRGGEVVSLALPHAREPVGLRLAVAGRPSPGSRRGKFYLPELSVEDKYFRAA